MDAENCNKYYVRLCAKQNFYRIIKSIAAQINSLKCSLKLHISFNVYKRKIVINNDNVIIINDLYKIFQEVIGLNRFLSINLISRIKLISKI